MEKTDPHSRQSVGGQSAEQGSELNISQVQPAQVEPQDAHWLRMDPSLTRAVLAKTEEELLGSLAALMRNKVEHEQASRRFAQVQIDTKRARDELESINKQIRRAEEEVAARLNEQNRINEEIVRVQQELVIIREGHQRHAEMVSGLQNETALMQQLLAEAHRDLSIVKAAAETQLAAHQESIAQLGRLKNEKAALEESLAPLRQEVDERISAREALIAEAVILHQQVSDLATQKEQKALELADLQNESAGAAMKQQRLQLSMSEEQAQLSDLLDRKTALERAVAAAAERRAALHTEVTALEARLHGLTAEKIEESRTAEGLPLLFGTESHKIAPEWDPYPLESEFHTDDVLDAKKVAELVALLPGLEGCLIVKNHGPVLASQMPERIHAHLKVPDRDYQLLFERLEKKVEEYNLQNARLATFDLGGEALTVAQANHAFVFVNHGQTRLRPGLPGKLASIVSEVAKMYP